MSTNNTSFYKEVDKSTLAVNLKTTKFLDCVLTVACAVIESNIFVSLHIPLIGMRVPTSLKHTQPQNMTVLNISAQNFHTVYWGKYFLYM